MRTCGKRLACASQTINSLSLSKVYIETELLEAGNVNPLTYCQKWVPILYNIQPGTRGWKTACIKELARVTKAAVSTVKNWGTEFEGHPDYVRVILDQADIINQMQQILKNVPDISIDD